MQWLKGLLGGALLAASFVVAPVTISSLSAQTEVGTPSHSEEVAYRGRYYRRNYPARVYYRNNYYPVYRTRGYYYNNYPYRSYYNPYQSGVYFRIRI